MRSVFAKLLILPLLLLFVTDSISAQEKQRYQSLQHALFTAGQALSGDQGPQNIVWIEGGDRFSYMEQNHEADSREIRVYDPATGDDELIFDTSEYTFPGTDQPFQFRSFQWSDDFRYLVFQTNFSPIYRYSGTSDYYYYSIENDTIELIVSDAFTAELSPNGQKLAYHKDGEMYLFDMNSEEVTRLTHDAEENFFNGRYGWVYEEEFGQVQAWEWSHDSSYIAFWQSDERHVERFISTDYEGQYPEYTDIPYPKVGAENPTVKIGVIDIEKAETTWMDLDIGDGYIPRIYWTSVDQQLAITHLNRPQNHLSVYMHDVTDGTGQLIMEEKNEDGWIDVFDFFAGIDDLFFFPDDREEFLWVSDRDGWSHIYRYNYDGEIINQVTDGDWEVTNLFAVNSDEEKIYYESTKESPLERHLYSIQFDGTEETKLTEEAGRHSISMGQNGHYYIDRYSNVELPTRVELRTTKNGGEKLETFANNQSTHDYLEDYVYAPRELFSFTTDAGHTLDGYIIKPIDFDPEELYPLILNVYGGPGAQGVYNEFETNPWLQYLAQEGYVIANVNNRGSGGYGHDFEKAVYENLGIKEAYDFAETARYLGAKEWVDKKRMAIRGHSYGGYMAALTMVLHPEVFTAGIVAAPVTDWRLYDTIYTERYMGLLEDNEEGYKQGSVMEHARNLEGNMLVVHSSMDENVHIQNTMQMVTAFTNAGKDVDLRIYPPGEHGVAYNQQSYLLLHQVYTRFLDRHLK